jgi:UDP-N-acetylenolpyruvoylglucosamine reductase
MPKGADLAPYSFFHVGGKALGVHDWPDERSFCHVMSVPAPGEYPRRVVGMGSNSWFSDLFWPGSVMRLAAPKDGGMHESAVDNAPCAATDGAAAPTFPGQGGVSCTVSCGVKGGVLLDWLEERGFSGLECMDSIPGTVGGWLAMNAGVKDGCVGGRVAWIRCLNPDGKVATLQGRECGFGYRVCAALENRVALACGLALTRSTPEAVKAARLAYRAKRIPLAGLRTCGSVFRNPPGDSAGRLLDAAGCKGLRVGGARVTEFHANIIATEEGANASDVLALALIMRNRVRAQDGIELVPEIAGLEFGDCE